MSSIYNVFYRDSIDSADEAEETMTTGEWSLVCSTLEEWQDFIKQLKKSNHKQDKKLKKVLAKDFLGLIPDIIEEKVSGVSHSFVQVSMCHLSFGV